MINGSGIARRTRSQEALYFKRVYESMHGVTDDNVRVGECSGSKRTRSAGGRGRARAGAPVKLQSGRRNEGSRSSKIDIPEVIPIEEEEEEKEGEVEGETDESGGEEAPSESSSEGSGLNRRPESEPKGVVIIDVDESQEEYEDEGSSDGEFINTSVGSESTEKAGPEKIKNLQYLEEEEEEEEEDGDNVRTPCRRKDEHQLDFNHKEKNCIARRTRSNVRCCKKPQNIRTSTYLDSEDSESSTDDDNDDTEDKDYEMDGSHNSCSVEESNSDEVESSSDEGNEGEEETSTSVEGDGESSDVEVVKTGNSDRKGNDGSVGTQLRRNRFSGMDTALPSCSAKRVSSLLPSNSGKPNSRRKVDYDAFVAKQTPLQFGLGSEKEMELGTASHPICLEKEEIDFLSNHSESDDEDNDEKVGGIDENNDNYETREGDTKEIGGEKEDEIGNPTKRKRVHAPQADQLFMAMVNSIWEKEDLIEKLIPKRDIAMPVVEPELSLKFSFGIEKPKPVEKSDFEKELDQLWTEFDFALKSDEIGSFSSVVENEYSNVPESEMNQDTLCRLGKHELILDERIGIRCKFCSFIKLEIKYVLPPLGTNPVERSGKRTTSAEDDASLLDGLHFEDASVDLCGSSVHTRGTVWDIVPGVRETMYPHQQEGFEFMWKNLAGDVDLEKLNKSTGSDGVGGCVISHAPGTGKTLLTIIFLQTYMRQYPSCRPLIIAPRSMLLTWEEEFKKWKVDIPFHNLNKLEFSGKEKLAALSLMKISAHRNKNFTRMIKLFSWNSETSILGISYPLFEKLAGERFVLDKEGEQIRKILLQKPGLLVLDEGHTPRNERSQIWKALSKIETEKRIILSGTPFQNNFNELYNTLCLVRPTFAEKIQSQPRKIYQGKIVAEKKEAKGKWTSLTSSIGKHDDRLEELRAMIDPFVHVHKGNILKENLPGLRDCVIVLHPPPLQKRLLQAIQGIQNPLELEYMVSLLSVHPSLLISMKGSFPRKEECNIEESINEDMLERIKLDPNEGVKIRFLMELIRLSEAMNEKVLVFSQFIEPFSFIKEQLRSFFGWTEGKEVLQMDGKLDVKIRQSSINLFNDPTSEVRILLASMKACSEGINLVGASRVVLLDVVWNPSVERQAISRAYRLGQKKVVYTYHLITSGTKEGEKYCRQAEKDRLSELVFSSRHMDGDKLNASPTVLKDEMEDKILEEMVRHNKLKGMFEKIIYQPKDSNLFGDFWLNNSQTST